MVPGKRGLYNATYVEILLADPEQMLGYASLTQPAELQNWMIVGLYCANPTDKKYTRRSG